MRVVLTAQVERAASGRDLPVRYGSLADILTVPDIGQFKNDVTLINAENGTYKGYALRVAAQGTRYEASLVPDKGCGLAFFADERNVIYTGRGLGCDEKK